MVFIVEGTNDASLLEQQILPCLLDINLSILPQAQIFIFGTCIYKIYQAISDDSDLDTIEILREQHKNDLKNKIHQLDRSRVAEIYMFFDCDPHATNYAPEKLKEIVNFFQDETDKGLIFISFPMIESFRHCYKVLSYTDTLQNLKNTQRTQDLKEYKSLVANTHKDIKHIDCSSTVLKVIKHTIHHCNHLLSERYEYPLEIEKNNINQIEILKKQPIIQARSNEVHEFYIISAIPLFIFNYNRYEELKAILNLQHPI